MTRLDQLETVAGLGTVESERLFALARRLMPGGVSSPVRAFHGVGGTPRFIRRGSGAWLEDVDGNRFVDLVLSWGPLILGHAHPAVLAAITEAASAGTTFGAPTELEVQLAEVVVATFPSIEMVRFVSSGTEAVMSALRLARAATNRTIVVKFAGCYHGHADGMLASAGSGIATLGLPDSPGVNAATVADTLVAPYNDLGAVEQLFEVKGEQIAAVIVEPVAGNMGLVLPQPGYLQGLREVTRRFGALLIFDEVMTGWRVHPQGAQAFYGVNPDLTTLGKVVGGGLPAAAYGGRSELMQLVAPAGPVYQAGTLSGNPLAMAAGLATLRELQRPGMWHSAEVWAIQAVDLFTQAAKAAGVALTVQRAGTMFTPFFTAKPVRNYAEAKTADLTVYRRFFHLMLASGVYLPASQFEASFTSTAHGSGELARLEGALSNALRVG